MSIDAYDVHAALLAHLRAALPSGQVHDGDVTDPTVDATGHVQPYWVLWFAPGTDPDRPLTRERTTTEHQLQLTAVGAGTSSTLWAVDAATTALDGLHLVTDVVDVTVRWPDGFQPPPAREDRDVDPSRWFIPLQFTAVAV